MDRIDAMQVLLAVVDSGSLSAGSRALRTPLPSVSRKVADLERHLGTNLLIRTSRNVQLTDAGRDYVSAARQIVAQIKEAEVRASGEYEVPRGELAITTPMAFGRQRVLPLAYQFLREHADITLKVLSVDRVVNLVEEQVHVGVRLGDLADSSLVAIKVGDFNLLTAASPDYIARMGRPRHPDDLVRHDAVIHDPLNESIWLYHSGGGTIQGRPNARVRTNTSTAAVTAAIEGAGLVRAPSYQLASGLRSGKLVTVLDAFDVKSYPVHLVYVRQGLLPLKVRTFLDWMTPRLRKTLKDLGEYNPLAAD